MNLSRTLLFLIVMMLASVSAIEAQRRWERLPPPRDPQFYEPRNKLEDFDGRMETVLVKGRSWAGTLRAQNGTARVEAVEIRDSSNNAQATGVIITINADGGPPGEIRSLIDYDEIDALVKAMDTAAKAGEGITRLTHFEVHYRSKGDFEVMVFKQISNNAIAAAIEGGFFDRSRLLMTLEDFTRLRWMIVQAREKLDEMK
jgi:hypothetical protein